MDTKRMRFGLVFNGTMPSMESGFLKEIGPIRAEGCCSDGKNYMMLCTRRPRKASDVVELIASYKRAGELSDMELLGDEKITVFEKGNKFRVHPIGQTILRMTQDPSYWSWPQGVTSKRRALSELESDLVRVEPTAPKRVKVIVPCVIGGLLCVVRGELVLTNFGRLGQSPRHRRCLRRAGKPRRLPSPAGLRGPMVARRKASCPCS